MPTLDPQLNQIIWWIVLGAFIGWLLWVIIDRFVWRDGDSAGAIDEEQHASVIAELESARREENLLRTELVREQEETQRLIGITKDLRDKLDGQEQIVANLEAALDAARYSAPGAAAALAQDDSLSSESPPTNTTLAIRPDADNDGVEPNSGAASKGERNDPPEIQAGIDGEQALRDLLAESDFNEDIDDLLGNDDDLFGAPTEVLTMRGRLSETPSDSDPFNTSSRIRYTKPAPPSNSDTAVKAQNGPMTDAELDRLLNLDTGKLYAEGIDPKPSDENLDGHTLTMLERLRDERGSDRPPTDSSENAARDSSLISRLRSAFGRKPDEDDR